MTTRTIVKDFSYKGQHFVVIQITSGEHAGAYMIINKADLDAEGRLTKPVYGGFKTPAEAIDTTKKRIDFEEYKAQGMDEMEALKRACGIA